MIYPRVDKLLNQVPDRYGLVLVAAKRARQINNYHHQLGEGTFEDFPLRVDRHIEGHQAAQNQRRQGDR